MSLKALFFVEGFTDIRFVTGLASISALTLYVPAHHYHTSGLKERVRASGIALNVVEVPGGRVAYQLRSLAWLWRNIRQFDVVISQELMRGSLNATIVGALRGIPVVTTLSLPPVEYFRCRRRRGQIGWFSALAGEGAIRLVMTVNGRLSACCVALGSYLGTIARQYCRRVEPGGYYGVDTTYFAPVDDEQRLALRRKRGLPEAPFIIFLSSRISHEKDPETVIRATALARAQGLDAVLVNLSGGHKEFLRVAGSLGLPDVDRWVIGRDAVHPMTEVADFFNAADVVAQGSLEEGLGLSTLEALACGVPVVATNVGGMAVHLPGYAQLTPIGDAQAMAEAFVWVARNRPAARAQALEGRAMVERLWSREKSFEDLRSVMHTLVSQPA